MKIINSLIAIVFLIVGAFIYTLYLSRPVFDWQLDNDKLLSEMRIAPINEALTFARLSSGDVLLVVDTSKDGVVAVDLQPLADRLFVDAIEAYHIIGKDQLKAIAASANRKSYAWDQLDIPVAEKSYPHVGGGTNYKAHAAEVGHTDDPFLFPKLSHITRWNADVEDGVRLDYEVELCVVPMTDHSSENPAQLAYILCNDFTDRWLLAKTIDTAATRGPTGFPAGKGGETRFPVGFLLVIPEIANFYEKIQMDLYLNNDLRQHASASEMIWDPERIIAETLIDCDVPYHLYSKTLTMLMSCDKIPARTFILTGTPEGVMFKIITLLNPLAYIQIGDVVTASATYLGFTRNTVK